MESLHMIGGIGMSKMIKKNHQKESQLPTKAQILREIAKDFEQTDIKTNKSEEDLFWEEYQKMRGEDES